MRVRYVYVRELFVNGSTGLGAITCISGGTQVLFISEDYSAVPRGGVSVPRFVVAGCSICVCCIEVSCEMLFWRSG